jgi:mannose-6-phosphate isomerase-like protein (cupin superfamily)
MYQTIKLKDKPDDIAPDGSEIYLLTNLKGGGMCVCQLPVGKTSKAVCHKTVEEIWFFLSGVGEVWRRYQDHEEVKSVEKGTALTIPLGCHFQFRNTGKKPLKFTITTMPPWPGAEEAIKVKNFWESK